MEKNSLPDLVKGLRFFARVPLKPIISLQQSAGSSLRVLGLEESKTLRDGMRATYLKNLISSDVIDEPHRRVRAAILSDEERRNFSVVDRRSHSRKLVRPLEPDKFKDNFIALQTVAKRIQELQVESAKRAAEIAEEQGKTGPGFYLMTLDEIKETILRGEYFYLRTPEGNEASFYVQKIGEFQATDPSHSLLLMSPDRTQTKSLTQVPIYKLGGLTIGNIRLIGNYTPTLKFSEYGVIGTALEGVNEGIIIGRTFDHMGRFLQGWLGYEPYSKAELEVDLPASHDAYFKQSAQGLKEDDGKKLFLHFPGGLKPANRVEGFLETLGGIRKQIKRDMALWEQRNEVIL